MWREGDGVALFKIAVVFILGIATIWVGVRAGDWVSYWFWYPFRESGALDALLGNGSS